MFYSSPTMIEQYAVIAVCGRDPDAGVSLTASEPETGDGTGCKGAAHHYVGRSSS